MSNHKADITDFDTTCSNTLNFKFTVGLSGAHTLLSPREATSLSVLTVLDSVKAAGCSAL